MNPRQNGSTKNNSNKETIMKLLCHRLSRDGKSLRENHPSPHQVDHIYYMANHHLHLQQKKIVNNSYHYLNMRGIENSILLSELTTLSSEGY